MARWGDKTHTTDLYRMPMHGIWEQCPKHEDDYAMGAML